MMSMSSGLVGEVVDLLVGPAEGVEIEGGQLGFGDVEAAADGGADLPLALFVVADEGEGKVDGAGLAEQDGGGGGSQRKHLEDLLHGDVEHGVDDREQADEVLLGGGLTGDGSEELAEAGAVEAEEHEFGRLVGVGSEAGGGGDGDELAELDLADQDQGLADGGDAAAGAEAGGVDEAEQAEAERGLGADEALDLIGIGVGIVDGAEDLEVNDAVGGDLAAGEDGGMGEEVALEEVVALAEGAIELLGGLDLFGDERGAGAFKLRWIWRSWAGVQAWKSSLM